MWEVGFLEGPRSQSQKKRSILEGISTAERGQVTLSLRGHHVQRKVQASVIMWLFGEGLADRLRRPGLQGNF